MYLYFISATNETHNYHTGTAIWRQIQEDAMWQLHDVILLALYKTPKAEVEAYSADSATMSLGATGQLSGLFENDIKPIQ